MHASPRPRQVDDFDGRKIKSTHYSLIFRSAHLASNLAVARGPMAAVRSGLAQNRRKTGSPRWAAWPHRTALRCANATPGPPAQPNCWRCIGKSLPAQTKNAHENAEGIHPRGSFGVVGARDAQDLPGCQRGIPAGRPLEEELTRRGRPDLRVRR